MSTSTFFYSGKITGKLIYNRWPCKILRRLTNGSHHTYHMLRKCKCTPGFCCKWENLSFSDIIIKSGTAQTDFQNISLLFVVKISVTAYGSACVQLMVFVNWFLRFPNWYCYRNRFWQSIMVKFSYLLPARTSETLSRIYQYVHDLWSPYVWVRRSTYWLLLSITYISGTGIRY